MIHIVPHCALYTGSITFGVSFTKVIAPVMWYRILTVRSYSQGIGMFSRSLKIACGMYLRAPK